MAVEENINYDQFSVFGSPDEEAATIGRSTASYRTGMAEDIMSKTAEGGYGFPDTYQHVLERGNLNRGDLLALQHNPPSVVRDQPFVHGRTGEYDPFDNVVTVQTPSETPERHAEDVNTMAHELGHHMHMSNAYQSGRMGRLGGDEADPQLEGVADGFADRVTGHRSSPYEDIFADGDEYSPEEQASYTTSRKQAAAGEWPSTYAGNSRTLPPRGPVSRSHDPVHTQLELPLENPRAGNPSKEQLRSMF